MTAEQVAWENGGYAVGGPSELRTGDMVDCEECRAALARVPLGTMTYTITLTMTRERGETVLTLRREDAGDDEVREYRCATSTRELRSSDRPPREFLLLMVRGLLEDMGDVDAPVLFDRCVEVSEGETPQKGATHERASVHAARRDPARAVAGQAARLRRRRGGRRRVRNDPRRDAGDASRGRALVASWSLVRSRLLRERAGGAHGEDAQGSSGAA